MSGQAGNRYPGCGAFAGGKAMEQSNAVTGAFEAVARERHVDEESSVRELRTLGERCRRLATRTSEKPVSSALRDMATDFDSIASALAGPKLSA